MNSNKQKIICSFYIINRLIILSFKNVIEEIFKLDFNKAFFSIHSIENSYLIADKILKNANCDNLDQTTIDSFNHIYNSYCIAKQTLLNLKHIRGDDYICVYDKQAYYNSFILSDNILYAQYISQHITIITGILIQINVILKYYNIPENNFLWLWYNQIKNIIYILIQYYTKIIEDYYLLIDKINNKQIKQEQDIELVGATSSYNNIKIYKKNYDRKNNKYKHKY